MKDTFINIRCDKAFKERIQSFANARNMTISATIVGLMNKAIDDIERKQFFRNAFKTLDINLNDYDD